jgi:MFS family permease
VPLKLFKSPAFLGANVVTLFLYAAISIFFFLFPMELIQLEGFSATAAGAAALPMILLMFLLSRWSGGLVEKYGGRMPLLIGPFIVAAGFLLFTLFPAWTNYWNSLFPAFVVLGLGMTITVAPLTTVVMNSVDKDYTGAASGINNAVARVAGVLAIAVFGIVMLQVFSSSLDRDLSSSVFPPNAIQEIRSRKIELANLEPPKELDARQQEALQRAISEAFHSGLRIVLFCCVGLSVASALTSWWLVPSSKRPSSNDKGGNSR